MADDELSERLEINSTRKHGRGIYAKADHKRGELVLSSKNPLSIVLCKEFRGARCDHCLQENTELVKCSRCKFVHYCGRSCQKQDWKHHKHECRCLSRVAPKQPTDLCRLMSRLLFSHFLNELRECHGKQFVNSLVSNGDLMGDERKFGLRSICMMILEYIGDDLSYMDVTERQLFDMVCAASCNCFTVTLEESEALGVALYSWPSYLNHSCVPNVTVTFIESSLYARAVRDIVCGEEVTISYVEQMAFYSDRQKELFDRYCFKCQCPRCANNDDLDMDQLMTSCKCANVDCDQPVFTEHSFCPACYAPLKDFDESKQKTIEQSLMDSIANAVDNSKTKQYTALSDSINKADDVLHCMNLVFVQALEKASDLAVTLEHYDDALKFSKQLIEPYQKYRGGTKYHPTIGLEMFKIGKLESYLGNLREALWSFSEAEEILSVTHGDSHPLLKSLLYHLQSARYELSGPPISSVSD